MLVDQAFVKAFTCYFFIVCRISIKFDTNNKTDYCI